jgi:hypothetical protein
MNHLPGYWLCFASAVVKRTVDAPGQSERENAFGVLIPPDVPRHGRGKVRSICIC